jgi:hypothetical protein
MSDRHGWGIALSAALLVACGGGGGNAGNDAQPPVATPTALLNNANQDISAQEATSTAFLPLFTSGQLVGARMADESVLFKIAQTQLDKLPAYFAQARAGATLTGVVQTDVINCPYGGTLTVSTSTANTSGVMAAGDSASITGNNCLEAEGSITGTLRFAIDSLAGDPNSGNYTSVITLTFEGLSSRTTSYSASLNGPLTLGTTVNGFDNTNRTYATPSLEVSALYAGEIRSRTLTDFQASVTTSPDTTYGSTSTYKMRGAVTSSALASQTVKFDTTMPWVVLPWDAYPSSGMMSILGAAGSHIRLTAMSNTQVRQELDANGDGNFEGSKAVGWPSLL